MSVIETPEQRWDTTLKPLHQTGEVTWEVLLSRLSPPDVTNMRTLSKLITDTAQTYKVKTKSLLVGSGADLSDPEYRDLDIFVHTEPLEKRQMIASKVFATLKSDYHIMTYPRGSAITFRDIRKPNQFMFGFTDAENVRIGAPIDLTFSDSTDGSYEVVRDYHRFFKLAFCELPVI